MNIFCFKIISIFAQNLNVHHILFMFSLFSKNLFLPSRMMQKNNVPTLILSNYFFHCFAFHHTFSAFQSALGTKRNTISKKFYLEKMNIQIKCDFSRKNVRLHDFSFFFLSKNQINVVYSTWNANSIVLIYPDNLHFWFLLYRKIEET